MLLCIFYYGRSRKMSGCSENISDTLGCALYATCFSYHIFFVMFYVTEQLHHNLESAHN